jgi:hypothetical protein
MSWSSFDAPDTLSKTFWIDPAVTTRFTPPFGSPH